MNTEIKNQKVYFIGYIQMCVYLHISIYNICTYETTIVTVHNFRVLFEKSVNEKDVNQNKFCLTRYVSNTHAMYLFQT